MACSCRGTGDGEAGVSRLFVLAALLLVVVAAVVVYLETAFRG
jgi:MYXO-CTERM domain-containing protein